MFGCLPIEVLASILSYLNGIDQINTQKISRKFYRAWDIVVKRKIRILTSPMKILSHIPIHSDALYHLAYHDEILTLKTFAHDPVFKAILGTLIRYAASSGAKTTAQFVGTYMERCNNKLFKIEDDFVGRLIHWGFYFILPHISIPLMIKHTDEDVDHLIDSKSKYRVQTLNLLINTLYFNTICLRVLSRDSIDLENEFIKLDRRYTRRLIYHCAHSNRLEQLKRLLSRASVNDRNEAIDVALQYNKTEPLKILIGDNKTPVNMAIMTLGKYLSTFTDAILNIVIDEANKYSQSGEMRDRIECLKERKVYRRSTD